MGQNNFFWFLWNVGPMAPAVSRFTFFVGGMCVCIIEALLWTCSCATHMPLNCQKGDFSDRSECSVFFDAFTFVLFCPNTLPICAASSFCIDPQNKCHNVVLYFFSFILQLIHEWIFCCLKFLCQVVPSYFWNISQLILLCGDLLVFVIKAPDMKDFSSCDSNLFPLFWLSALVL